MPTINQLSTATSLSTADKMVIYSQDNGDSRKATLATLITFLQENYQEDCTTTLIVTPSSGDNVVLPTQTTDLWLIVSTPNQVVGTPLTSLTVTLPPIASLYDSQEIFIGTAIGISLLSVSGNGATVFGAPTSMISGGLVGFKYNIEQTAWYSTAPTVGTSFSTLTLTQGINDANGNELIKVSSTAGAVNEITVTNAAAGSDPSISATGNDTNIDLNLVPKGTGKVQAGGVEVVTLSGTQTLTSKTLTSPTITGATLTSPTMTGAALGTPTSGTLTSCTGLPIGSGVSGLGANVATFLATPSSANLRATVTDETGTGGSLVFATSPTLRGSVIVTAGAIDVTVESQGDSPYIRLEAVSFDNLPSPSLAKRGARATITDGASGLSYNTTLVSGTNAGVGVGTTIYPVWCNGTQWKIG